MAVIIVPGSRKFRLQFLNTANQGLLLPRGIISHAAGELVVLIDPRSCGALTAMGAGSDIPWETDR